MQVKMEIIKWPAFLPWLILVTTVKTMADVPDGGTCINTLLLLALVNIRPRPLSFHALRLPDHAKSVALLLINVPFDE